MSFCNMEFLEIHAILWKFNEVVDLFVVVVVVVCFVVVVVCFDFVVVVVASNLNRRI